MTVSVFDLPERLAAKAEPALIADDERRFRAIAAAVERQLSELEARLDETRLRGGDNNQEVLERDLAVHELSARIRMLHRFGLDVCLGRMVAEDDPEPVYIGRLSLADEDGTRLLVDWRAPAAEPFFAATHANPMGLASRRRYRWTRGRVTDYWDEVFTAEGLEHNAALDDQSAFIASLGASRSPQMRDVLATIQADQDAIIRSPSRGPLVVDGGPGTGKTVVALHRTAYLLYADPRLGHRRGGVLFVGPHEPYLSYVADVLPSLGEEGVQTCTLRDLVPEGRTAGVETDPEAARLKASARLVDAVENAVRAYERPPEEELTVQTPWGTVWIGPSEWAEAFDAVEPGTTHNEARAVVWESVLEILVDQVDAQTPPHLVRRALAQHRELTRTFTRAWPVLDPAGVVADLWSVPAYLRLHAPWLDAGEVRALTRQDGRAWTTADLPYLDAARRLIGDPDAVRVARRRAAALESEREVRERVVEELIAADDDREGEVQALRQQPFADRLIDEAALPSLAPDELAGPYAHVVVDEAQELTDAEWTMLLRRAPSHSLTIVGDRAQARHGFHESWQDRLARVGLDDVRMSTLTVNYRTPEEVMAEAEPVIRAAIPDANVPVAVRSSGIPVLHLPLSARDGVLEEWLATHGEGVACVIGDGTFAGMPRVRSLTPELAKGLEFDLVLVVDPETWGDGVEGAVDRYVAMTRATQQLVVLRSEGAEGADA
ncbi:AAA family ATPase [Protaetiibacter sp. SSC-01]|uniref:RNA polymerase recycling motor ATPase HelR n=1 Tax=Protaetiibacter sp. SSC-01 TaxID=2759943 RepID=UPI001656A009|nr:RNA polymerase recycling motor ATPase HelR [Protaetiibacter sp. SSC-01]QNO36511.1 AAA family ATPase [Protaetiibacter sp. SSC-01]